MAVDKLQLYRPTLVDILVFAWEPGNGSSASRRDIHSKKELLRRMRKVPSFPRAVDIHYEKDLVIVTYRKTPFESSTSDTEQQDVKLEDLANT